MKKLLSFSLSLIMLLSVLCIGIVPAYADPAFPNLIQVTPAGDAAEDINKALEAAHDSGQATTVKVTPGTYTLSARLTVFSNTYLDLTGVTFNKSATCKSVMLNIGKNSEIAKGFDHYNNVVINGGTFNANKVDASIILFYHASNVTIQNVTFENCKGGHDVTFAGCKNVTVTGCTFKNHVPSGNVNMEAIQLDILEKSHFPSLDNASYDGTTNEDVYITGNTFDSVNRGVGCHSAFLGKYMKNVNVTDNSFNNISGYAIIATNFINTNITGNAINNCASGIIYRAIVPESANTYVYKTATEPIVDTGSTIANNVINVIPSTDSSFNQYPYGIQVYGEILSSAKGKIPAGDYRAANINVSNNAITLNVKGVPIWVRGVINSSFNQNTIAQTVAYASSDKVKNQGIRVSDKSQNVDISSNIITGNNTIQCGVIVDNAKKISIASNNISKAKEMGVSINNSTATISNNTISASGQNGIYGYQKATITTKNNNISGSKKHGIFLNGIATKNVLNGDKITSSSNYGICLQKANASIKKVNISKSKKYGIFLTQGATASISGATVSNGSSDGIYSTQSSKANISSSTVKSNKGNGIYFTNKAKGSVKSTKIQKNSKTGIYLTKQAGKVTIQKVSYSANKGGKIKK